MKLFRQTFLFTGGEIVGEFLMSIGYLPGATARAALPSRASRRWRRRGWTGRRPSKNKGKTVAGPLF